ncbi:MAG TPA: leucine-rich repeat domain-containing protein [Anaerolineaceae bacterium]|nr:leucine-rich repeat domain-containing protein [Anaerolineaceae bacterium]HUM49264.1 leucine-rich repeat domain-containing protein [Anaerolineaceae bacterium]
MKNKVNRSFVLVLIVALLTLVSACSSKPPTQVTPVIVSTEQPTDTPAEVITNTPSVVLLRDFDCTVVTDVSQSECRALVVFYNATNGDGWLNKSGWLESPTVSNWYGVTVNEGHVSALNLSKNQLSGFLPAELGDLTYLGYLGLNDNQLTGNIPSELAKLTNLRGLALSNNQLSGNIPASLGSLTKLTSLYLSSNQLTGSVPSELGNLVNLQSLNIHNNLLSGSLPVSLVNLTSLQTFSFFGTSLCEPPTSDFQVWKSTVTQWYATGAVCK